MPAHRAAGAEGSGSGDVPVLVQGGAAKEKAPQEKAESLRDSGELQRTYTVGGSDVSSEVSLAPHPKACDCVGSPLKYVSLPTPLW